MSNSHTVTNVGALAFNRIRADKNPAYFLHDLVADEIKERLEEVNKTFTKIAIVTGLTKLWVEYFPDADLFADTETLTFTDSDYDLVIHAMCLHWANDPVGQLVQCRRVLKPDGLFLAALFGGSTLSELRETIGAVEIAHHGGLSPRILPMGEIRDLGALLQRAGFALPVADGTPFNVTYPTVQRLIHDLRNMGEGNALAQRNPKPLSKAFWDDVQSVYTTSHSNEEGRLIATFEVVTLTGWVPHNSQQQPLRPGSAQQRLADALNTDELPLKPKQDLT